MILTNPQAAGARERVLVASRGGGWFAVAELLPIGNTGELEVFEVTGFYHGKPRAGQVRAQLERSGRWLAEESKAAMRTGAVVRVGDLRWEP